MICQFWIAIWISKRTIWFVLDFSKWFGFRMICDDLDHEMIPFHCMYKSFSSVCYMTWINCYYIAPMQRDGYCNTIRVALKGIILARDCESALDKASLEPVLWFKQNVCVHHSSWCDEHSIQTVRVNLSTFRNARNSSIVYVFNVFIVVCKPVYLTDSYTIYYFKFFMWFICECF